MADPYDAITINATVEHAAANRCKLREETFGVFKRRGGRSLDARHRVVLMAHHDIAPTRKVTAEVVVPRVVVAVSVRNHDEWAHTERRNRCRVVDPLELHRVEDVGVVDVVRRDLRHSKRTCRREVDDVPEAWFIACAIDEIAIAEHAVAIRIDDEIEPAAGTEPVAAGDTGHRERDVWRGWVCGESNRLRYTAHVCQRGGSRPLRSCSVWNHVHVNDVAREIRKLQRVHREIDRRSDVERIEVDRVGRDRCLNARELRCDGRGCRARPPSAEEYGEIRSVDKSGAVDVRRRIGATPRAQKRREVGATNFAVGIDVTETATGGREASTGNERGQDHGAREGATATQTLRRPRGKATLCEFAARGGFSGIWTLQGAR